MVGWGGGVMGWKCWSGCGNDGVGTHENRFIVDSKFAYLNCGFPQLDTEPRVLLLRDLVGGRSSRRQVSWTPLMLFLGVTEQPQVPNNL